MKEDWAGIRETLRRDPNNALALRAVGRYYLGDERYKQAKESYVQAMSASPHLLPDILIDYENEIGRHYEQSGLRLSLAGFLLTVGETGPSLLELEESLEINPRDREIYNILGKLYIKLGRTDDTITLLERSLKEGVKDASLTEILAAAYLNKGRLKEAIKFYREISANRPNDKQVLRILGELYTREEAYDDAARCYQAMFSDDPEVGREVVQRLEELLQRLEGDILIREILAEIYTRSLQPDLAVAKLSEISRLDSEKNEAVIAKIRGILKSYPDHPQATMALAEALRRQGNLSEAIELYQSLAKAKPELIDQAMLGYREILESFPDQALARTYLAEAFLNRRQIGEALIELEKMMRIDPETAELVIKKCREILRQEPGLLEGHLVLGRAYLFCGETQRAVMEAENVISADKKMTAAYRLLGETYIKTNQAGRAVEVLKTALNQEPYDQETHRQYREALLRSTQQEIQLLKQKLTDDPWKTSWHFDLARLHLRLDQEEEAIRELQLIMKDQAKVPAASNLLGEIYRGEGLYERAIDQFTRGLENPPPEIFLTLQANLGSVYEASGEARKALKCYELVLQEDLDFAGLQKRVKSLKATSLPSLRNKYLVMAVAYPGRLETVAGWGREGRSARGNRKDDMSVSFGQNYNTSGFEYFIKGMYKAALDEFTLATQLDARFSAALNNLAVCLAKEGKIKEARLKLEEAVQLEPLSAIIHNNFGAVLLLQGELGAARAELEKAREYDQELTAVMLNLGDAYYGEKKSEKALGLYQQIGEYDIMTEPAARRLRYLVP